jgi:hypothetical protein
MGSAPGARRLRNPEVIRVKISSEGAGAITISPVVLQQMTVEELLDVIVPLTGKDPERIDQTLRRGTIVSGSSRFRWDAWKPAPEHIYEWLARYPDPDPTVPFNSILRTVPGCV